MLHLAGIVVLGLLAIWLTAVLCGCVSARPAASVGSVTTSQPVEIQQPQAGGIAIQRLVESLEAWVDAAVELVAEIRTTVTAQAELSGQVGGLVARGPDNRTYEAGDPWPYRVLAAGMALALLAVAIVHGIRLWFDRWKLRRNFRRSHGLRHPEELEPGQEDTARSRGPPA